MCIRDRYSLSLQFRTEPQIKFAFRITEIRLYGVPKTALGTNNRRSVKAEMLESAAGSETIYRSTFAADAQQFFGINQFSTHRPEAGEETLPVSLKGFADITIRAGAELRFAFEQIMLCSFIASLQQIYLCV
eukprot:TRINITY_DN6884_c0_g1_i7.p1 TRINITY_DN6884_c0_g1~~TRINITY_DN6884_c0_g1_i7.p1  ORF type:complete len:132 (-),score=24.53 TRINITY_DN6884_c0_g1_i7:207-602(-)